jgi:hypothetical protein
MPSSARPKHLDHRETLRAEYINLYQALEVQKNIVVDENETAANRKQAAAVMLGFLVRCSTPLPKHRPYASSRQMVCDSSSG